MAKLLKKLILTAFLICLFTSLNNCIGTGGPANPVGGNGVGGGSLGTDPTGGGTGLGGGVGEAAPTSPQTSEDLTTPQEQFTIYIKVRPSGVSSADSCDQKFFLDERPMVYIKPISLDAVELNTSAEIEYEYEDTGGGNDSGGTPTIGELALDSKTQVAKQLDGEEDTITEGVYKDKVDVCGRLALAASLCDRRFVFTVKLDNQVVVESEGSLPCKGNLSEDLYKLTYPYDSNLMYPEYKPGKIPPSLLEIWLP